MGQGAVSAGALVEVPWGDDREEPARSPPLLALPAAGEQKAEGAPELWDVGWSHDDVPTQALPAAVDCGAAIGQGHGVRVGEQSEWRLPMAPVAQPRHTLPKKRRVRLCQ